MTGWSIQVVPIGDARQHHGDDCWCSPTEDEGCLVHHSLDEREAYERGERKPS